MAPTAAAPHLSDEQLGELLPLIGEADSVELKLTVPESDHHSVAAALGIDPVEAQIRQVYFFDTPDLSLNRRGVVLRARRVQRKGGDVIVKLRPLTPDELPKALRRSPAFTVEVDAMPGGFVCSGTLKRKVGNADVRQVVVGAQPLDTLLSQERVATGDPSKVQIMYGVGGERRLSEFELPELPGYEGSRPVRVGNAASEQFQLDVYGEVIATAFAASERLGRVEERLWPRWRAIVDYVATIWREPDEGIWEARGPRRHYTYSKVMAWVVFDRALRLAERFGLDAPEERWSRIRDEIHAEVCERGYDSERGTFTQYYGSKELDASTLNIPLVGFLPPTDDRVTGTIDAIRSDLGKDGFVARYSTDETDDGLPGGEGQFLACSFWLVTALALNGRSDEARVLFERLPDLRNDLGLLAEEYDVERRRQVGNFPQAFSHLALIEAAQAITTSEQAGDGGPVSVGAGETDGSRSDARLEDATQAAGR